MKDEKKNVERLVAIRRAIAGMCSGAEDPFGGFYKGGTAALMKDLEQVLADCGAATRKTDYYVAPYARQADGKWGRWWGICSSLSDPEGSWVMTGFDTSEEACRTLLDKDVFPDFEGVPRILA